MSADTLWFLEPIRNAIGAPAAEDPEHLREAAAAFNEACRSTNRRLREAGRLLHSGLRSEAIQMAELEPALLDMVVELDSVLEDWQGMLAQWGIELPPDLELDLASELNAAYAELQPLEHLLKKHRMLALARAPLSARITALRQIARLDGSTEAWREDLEAYEGQRLLEIHNEAHNAEKRRDLARLLALRSEVASEAWLTQPPLKLTAAIDRACAMHEQADARSRINELGEALNQAYMEFDLPRAAKLAELWRQLQNVANLADNDRIVVDSAAALEWVASEQDLIYKQNRFEAAIGAMEKALDGHAPRQELETLLLKAERFQLPLPDLLLRRVRERIETHQLLARRKGLLLGGTAATLALMLIGGVAFYWWRDGELQRLQAQVSQLQQLSEEGKWRQLLSQADTFDPSKRQLPEISSLVLEAEHQLQAEEQRAKEVEAMLVEAEQSPIDSISQEALSVLRKEVMLSQEKRRLAAIDMRIRRAREQRQAEIDARFSKTVSDWAEEIEALAKQGGMKDVDFYGLLAQLDAELSQHSGVSSRLLPTANPLRSKLRALQVERDGKRDLRQATANLGSSVGSIARFHDALADLIRRHKESTAGVHAERVMQQEDAWGAIIHWATFWRSCRSNWSRIDPALAEQIVREGDRLSSSYPRNPLQQAFADSKPYLAHIDARKQANISGLKSFLIQDARTSNVWLVIDKKGQRYYCPKQPEPIAASRVRFDYFSGYNSLKPTEIADPGWIGLSPQSECCNTLARILSDYSEKNWDNTFLDVVDTIQKASPGRDSDPPMDPVLALRWLVKVLEEGSKGSYLLERTFAPLIDEIENSGVDLALNQATVAGGVG